MLAHALYENGVMHTTELESYVHDDIERNVQRLEDVNRRLQTSYQDLLSVSNRVSNVNQRILRIVLQ